MSAKQENAQLARIAANEKYMNERVKLKLIKDNFRYKEPVFVSVNGYQARIPRGVEVEIPRFAALALQESAAQDEKTSALTEGLQDDFERSTGQL